MGAVIVRDATPDDLPAVGTLRVDAYVAGGFLRRSDSYAVTLRLLGTQDDGAVLVAEDEGRILGTVMVAAGASTELGDSAGTADIRALAVAPDSQSRGVGRLLLRSAISQAAADGVHRLLLSTQPDMRAAHHLYETEGFTRAPELDWQPVPGYTLLVYEMRIAPEMRVTRRGHRAGPGTR
jgi:ribosomal protein S18 acetylase RimI-like enzyme